MFETTRQMIVSSFMALPLMMIAFTLFVGLGIGNIGLIILLLGQILIVPAASMLPAASSLPAAFYLPARCPHPPASLHARWDGGPSLVHSLSGVSMRDERMQLGHFAIERHEDPSGDEVSWLLACRGGGWVRA